MSSNPPVQSPQAHKPTFWAALAAAVAAIGLLVKGAPTPTVIVQPASTPAATASAPPSCSQPAVGNYAIWALAAKTTCLRGQKLPSGNLIGGAGTIGPCFQKNLAYDGRNGNGGSLSFKNPFHYGDQPDYCGSADKDPFSGKDIMWDGSKFVNE